MLDVAPAALATFGVRVLNASNQRGKAQSVADELMNQGFSHAEQSSRRRPPLSNRDMNCVRPDSVRRRREGQRCPMVGRPLRAAGHRRARDRRRRPLHGDRDVADAQAALEDRVGGSAQPEDRCRSPALIKAVHSWQMLTPHLPDTPSRSGAGQIGSGSSAPQSSSKARSDAASAGAMATVTSPASGTRSGWRGDDQKRRPLRRSARRGPIPRRQTVFVVGIHRPSATRYRSSAAAPIRRMSRTCGNSSHDWAIRSAPPLRRVRKTGGNQCECRISRGARAARRCRAHRSRRRPIPRPRGRSVRARRRRPHRRPSAHRSAQRPTA